MLLLTLYSVQPTQSVICPQRQSGLVILNVWVWAKDNSKCWVLGRGYFLSCCLHPPHCIHAMWGMDPKMILTTEVIPNPGTTPKQTLKWSKFFFRVLNPKRSQWIKKYIIIIVINGIMDCSVVKETIKSSYFGPCKKLICGFSGKSGDHFAGRIIPWLICKKFLYHLYNERGLLTGFLFFAEGNKRKMECIQEWFLDHIQVIDSLPIMILLIGRYMA